MSRCRSCDAEIVWAKSNATGKNMPLDPASEDGNVILYDGEAYAFHDGEAARTELVDHQADFPGATLHFSHHMTCKDAAKWRR